VEPALNPQTALHGAIHLADDEVGNCRQFALLLKTELQNRGVAFRFNSVVAGIAQTASSKTPISALPTSLSATVFELIGSDPTVREHAFDAVVVCAGVDSAALLRPLGLKLPLVAVHGYSVSAPIKNPLDAPRAALMDERYKVAVSRLGQRVRVAGGAELGGSTGTPAGQHRAACVQTLYKVLEDWFPGAAQLGAGVQHWKGARPMLPDGPPLVGASGTPGVWLNLGHGSSGWALACGSARILADQIQGREPDIDVSGFRLDRA
jgi:D-amino-acid dehydrogenase